MVGAQEWLDVCATFPTTQLGPAAMLIALAIWLGETIPALVGTGVTDLTGRSTLSSAVGPGRIGRHDGVKELLMDMEIEAGSNRVVPEPRGLFLSRAAAEAAEAEAAAADPEYEPAPDGRRGDYLAHHRAAASKNVVDVAVIDGASATLLASLDHLAKPGLGLQQSETGKVTKYKSDIVPGFAFDAFAIGTQGELGANARRVLGRIANSIARRQNGGTDPPDGAAARIAISLRGRLGIAVMRGQAEQVLDVVVGLPPKRNAGAVGRARRPGGGKPWVHSRRRPVPPPRDQICTCQPPPLPCGDGSSEAAEETACCCAGTRAREWRAGTAPTRRAGTSVAPPPPPPMPLPPHLRVAAGAGAGAPPPPEQPLAAEEELLQQSAGVSPLAAQLPEASALGEAWGE